MSGAKCFRTKTIILRHRVAMTASPHTASRSRRDAPEVCIYLPPHGGRGECRVPTAPATSCALCIGRKHTSNNEYTGTAGIPARNGFNGLCRALPGDRALLPPSPADRFCLSPVGPTQLRELDASVGASAIRRTSYPWSRVGGPTGCRAEVRRAKGEGGPLRAS